MRQAVLNLAPLLLAVTGCQAAAPASPKAAGPAPPVATAPLPKPKSEDPPGSKYEELVHGPLARLARGEPVPTERRQIEFLCVATGEFNVAPEGDRLLMETWCVEEKPAGDSIRMFQADDTAAPRVPGKHVFRIAFQDAVVSVQDVGGKPEVRLHYRDPQGTFHHVDLAPRKGEKYVYSFAELSPDVVEPIGERRTIEMGR